MNEIVGRTNEKKELDSAFKSTDAEFIAVYGRRRVGKTYLIKNFFKLKECIFFQTAGIYKGALKDQLEQFSKELGTSFYQGADIKAPETWLNAFEKLTKAISSLPKRQKSCYFFR